VHILVISDLHVGKGKFLKNGQLNILEDFDEDEKLIDFLDYYSTNKYYFSDVHIVLNGDILNLIQMDVDGVYTHLITEDMTCKMLDGIFKGHPEFFAALKRFLSRPNKKMTYIIGNHDFGMVWPKAQEVFRKEVGDSLAFDHQIVINGVLIEHGHRFEAVNSVPRSKFFVDGPNGDKILNLPWGSLFCMYMMPLLKKERPHIDKVRPLGQYIWWSFVHDFRFFVKLAYMVIGYIIRTQFSSYTKFNKNFKTSIRLLKQINVYPKYDKCAKRIFATRPDVNIVVMGHTHIAEWRRFPEGKLYFNTGTWNSVPSLDIGKYKNLNELTYVCIEMNDKKGEVKNAYLNFWKGKWKPFNEEVSMTIGPSD
jgi:UDP-2,3-diacylglucosamine pyrophosphatase LpxH